MREALMAERPATELHSMRHTLMLLSHDADVVLDLHCDFEATVHMYVEQAMLDQMMPLAAAWAPRPCCGPMARAVRFRLTRRSRAPGGAWQNTLADNAPVPLACASTTVELRGQADVSSRPGGAGCPGHLSVSCNTAASWPAQRQPLPAALCEATPLAGTESLHAPHSGVIALRRRTG